jgi:precorrin-6B methylase 2
MNAIRKLLSDVDILEQQLASDIAKVAAELEPLPNQQNKTTLWIAWRKAASSQRKLAATLRNGLRQIHASNETKWTSGSLLRTARKELKAAKFRLQGWTRCRSIISAQLPLERRELTSTQDVQVMDQIMSVILDAVHRIANPAANMQGADAEKHGCTQDIPSPMNQFSIMIGAAHRICLVLKKQRPLRFLDVGCGGGIKVLAATTCFDLCDGLEYEKSTVTTGRRLLELLKLEQCKLIHGDALEFLNYQDYDVIYCHKPMMNVERMVEMEERIISQARPGTVLLTAGNLYTDDPGSKGVQRLTFNIYITGMSEGQASEIFEAAEYMGQMVPGFRPRKLAKPAYWTPVIEASARNGYFL